MKTIIHILMGCPFCNQPAETITMVHGKDLYRCPDKKCAGYPCLATLEQWNKRPDNTYTQ